MSRKIKFSHFILVVVLIMLTNSCKKDKQIQIPTITTTTVSNIAQSTATCGGNVTNDGGATITVRGVCWSTNQTPTNADSKTTDGTGTGSFTSNITGLTANTTYYARAYATNNKGTGYGKEVNYKTYTGYVTDIEGNAYYTVTIGTQVWMVENLKTTKYRDGTSIPNVTDSIWDNLTTGAYCDYNNTPSNSALYGRLYNWYAVADAHNICPLGWHVPSDSEWTILIDFIGGGYSPHGNELKSCRQVDSPLGGICNTSDHPRWDQNSPDYGTDNYGFSALPGGLRTDNLMSFGGIGRIANWWTSTAGSYVSAKARVLHVEFGGQAWIEDSKRNGFSVRCLRD
jgi:uncharacterized protein (TIGR02145 family)